MSALAVSTYVVNTIDTYCNTPSPTQTRVQQYTSLAGIDVLGYVPKIEKLGTKAAVILTDITDHEETRATHLQQITYEIGLVIHMTHHDAHAGGDDMKTLFNLVKAALRGAVIAVEITDPKTGETSRIEVLGRVMEGHIEEPTLAEAGAGLVRFLAEIRVLAKEGVWS